VNQGTQEGISRAQQLRTWARATVQNYRPDPTLTLSPGDKPGIVRHPFKLADRNEYLRQIRGSGIFKRAEEAAIQDVKLSELYGLQRHVNAERLQAHYDNPGLIPMGTRAPGHGGLVDVPTIVRVGGRLFAHDGHHRATAAHLRGQPSIRARVVDLDAAGWKVPDQPMNGGNNGT